MRSLLLFPVCVACAIVGLVLLSIDMPVHSDDIGSNLTEGRWSAHSDAAGELSAFAHSVELLLDIEAYEDLDYGFNVAIPTGWRKIVTADPEKVIDAESQADVFQDSGEGSGTTSRSELLLVEPGYAVGFESVQETRGDKFADYILIEILPGKDSGLFATDGTYRYPVTIDGRAAWYDRLEVDHASSGLTDVDLVIYQAELTGVGYTVGLYAIGEHSRERIMAAAFEIMLQTFQLNRSPFNISWNTDSAAYQSPSG